MNICEGEGPEKKSNFKRRLWEHKNKMGSAFSKRYNVDELVYYETSDDINLAIAREKQIKGGSLKRSYKHPEYEHTTTL